MYSTRKSTAQINKAKLKKIIEEYLKKDTILINVSTIHCKPFKNKSYF